jgi:hypothetical protein
MIPIPASVPDEVVLVRIDEVSQGPNCYGSEREPSINESPSKEELPCLQGAFAPCC